MIIAIAGDSSTGKSTLSQKIKERIPDTFVLECDRYHKWERGDSNWGHITHLNPKANDLERMLYDIKSLYNGHDIISRDYCHISGKFLDEEIIKPTRNLIVAGLHTLTIDFPYDIKIFMDIDRSLKKRWKVNRDVNERGYNLHQVLNNIRKREGDYIKFVLPQRENSDLVVRFSQSGLELIFLSVKISVEKLCSKLTKNQTGFSVSFIERTLVKIPNGTYEHIVDCILNE